MLTILETLTEGFKAILQDRCVGLYLHGSLCLGSFQWQSSDIDLIAVVYDEIDLETKTQIVEMLLKHQKEYPAKGLEFSLLKRKDCKNFQYPTPYLLHFSPLYIQEARKDSRTFSKKMHGTDPDLAAHLTVILNKGITLYGQEISKTFAPVPKKAYLQSILWDLKDSKTQIFEKPVYYLLNFARTLAFIQDDLVLSKKDGGQWAIQKKVPYSYLITQALQDPQKPFDNKELEACAKWYLDILEKNI